MRERRANVTHTGQNYQLNAEAAFRKVVSFCTVFSKSLTVASFLTDSPNSPSSSKPLEENGQR